MDIFCTEWRRAALIFCPGRPVSPCFCNPRPHRANHMLWVRMRIVKWVSERCQVVVLKIILPCLKDNGELVSQIATLGLESQTTVLFPVDGWPGEFVRAASTGSASPGKLHLATD